MAGRSKEERIGQMEGGHGRRGSLKKRSWGKKDGRRIVGR